MSVSVNHSSSWKEHTMVRKVIRQSVAHIVVSKLVWTVTKYNMSITSRSMSSGVETNTLLVCWWGHLLQRFQSSTSPSIITIKMKTNPKTDGALAYKIPHQNGRDCYVPYDIGGQPHNYRSQEWVGIGNLWNVSDAYRRSDASHWSKPVIECRNVMKFFEYSRRPMTAQNKMPETNHLLEVSVFTHQV